MEQNLISISKMAQVLGVSTNTIKRWYKWYENDDFEKPEGLVLPAYKTDNRGTKFFKVGDVVTFEQFMEDMKRGNKYHGCMADFNAAWQWGQRGTGIMERKKEKENGKKTSEQ